MEMFVNDPPQTAVLECKIVHFQTLIPDRDEAY